MSNNIHSVDEALEHAELFRVSIFGSARTQPGSKEYEDTFKLGQMLAESGVGVVTGGGPGQMDAANAGHESIDPEGTNSIGLTIELPWEGEHNEHLDIYKHFAKFGDRLDHFMALSNAVVISPGGIGTCLEFFYTLQLTQVRHICPIPIILMDPMWESLNDWLKGQPVDRGFVSPKDLNNIFVVNTPEEALEIIKQTKSAFDAGGGEVCANAQVYKLDTFGKKNVK